MKFIYRMGARLRNPSLFERFHFLKETEHWPLHRLREHQLAICRKFLTFAQDFSPYYRRVFQEAGFDPGKIRDLEELKRHPVRAGKY
jgi:phenylacetate-CoA ligase